MEKGVGFQKGVLWWNLGLMVQDRWVTGKMRHSDSGSVGNAAFAPAFKKVHASH